MIDEKTLPPPDRALNAASPPPAYPEPSSHHIPEISSSASPPTLTPASTSVPYPSQAPPNLSQSRSQSSFRSPMGSPPELATMSPPVQGAEPQQYPQGYPYPPAHQQQQPKGELVYAAPPQFPPGSMQQMQMDAQLGAQFQQQRMYLSQVLEQVYPDFVNSFHSIRSMCER